MSQTSLVRTYTVEEFEALPEFDASYELLDGKLIEKPMPGYEHSLIASIIMKYFYRFDFDGKIGVMLQELNVKLGPKNSPAPDLAFWKADRKPARLKGSAPLPDLAIEIWSPHDLDTQKRQEEARAKVQSYLASGVPIVWAINPENQTVEIYHSGNFNPVAILKIGDALDGEDVIPGFQVKVADLFVD